MQAEGKDNKQDSSSFEGGAEELAHSLSCYGVKSGETRGGGLPDGGHCCFCSKKFIGIVKSGRGFYPRRTDGRTNNLNLLHHKTPVTSPVSGVTFPGFVIAPELESESDCTVTRGTPSIIRYLGILRTNLTL